MRLLIVEDDPIITEGLKMALTQEGYEVCAVDRVKTAMEKMDEISRFDMCLLDVMLPDGDGYQICRAIRERSDVPILFLTACDDEVHTVLALEQGADDYIAKPFRIRELTARIRAILRRTKRQDGNGNAEGESASEKHLTKEGAFPRMETAMDKGEEEIVWIGQNELNLHTGKVFRQGEEIFLSAVEYRLLLVFVRSRGQLLSRQQILNDMWDSAGDFVNDNTLTVYVKRLRKKLEREGEEALIQTIRGIGYRLEA